MQVLDSKLICGLEHLGIVRISVLGQSAADTKMTMECIHEPMMIPAVNEVSESIIKPCNCQLGISDTREEKQSQQVLGISFEELLAYKFLIDLCNTFDSWHLPEQDAAQHLIGRCGD